MFSQLQILGHTGRDPELNFTSDGTAIWKFSVAVSKKTKSKEETTWYNCIAFRSLAEMLGNHLKKGQMVFVQGDLNIRQYTTKDGRNGMSLDVTIEKFQFAGSKKEGNANSADIEVLDDTLGSLDDHPF